MVLSNVVRATNSYPSPARTVLAAPARPSSRAGRRTGTRFGEVFGEGLGTWLDETGLPDNDPRSRDRFRFRRAFQRARELGASSRRRQLRRRFFALWPARWARAAHRGELVQRFEDPIVHGSGRSDQGVGRHG